ncbi:MAG: DUF2461 domain-containing protein [Eudoraea sp.]|nr:DUF2461 domain-containing protein [Eudoraea sp.]MBT8211491.1 DUF2461 domain-containing protein [Eudoraea sp.]MBT8223346.1 DUF2461 domain-containing protein [Eudoraea sp.]
MDFAKLFAFLEALQSNNNKSWMDANRKWYQEVRNDFILWLDDLDHALAEIDPEYYPTPGKKGINRINNNLMFHPHKPVYKDHFGAGLDKAPNTGDFYVQIGVSECMLAGGLWRPDPAKLRSVREAIDYNGEELLRILNRPDFQKRFGGLYEDVRLKGTPKGFSSSHPYLDLLQNKSFAVTCPLSRSEVLGGDIKGHIIQVYMEMLPFRRYLNEAITV